MAYMSQEKKKQLSTGIKAVLKKYGVKGSIAVRHHSSLVVNIASGELDFMSAFQKHNDEYARMRDVPAHDVGDNMQVNVYWVERWMNDIGETKIANFFKELINAMSGQGTGYYNNSDIMTDYFDVAWYNDINVGKWDKGYVCTA